MLLLTRHWHFVGLSIDQSQADEEAEEDLRVLEACYKKLVQWVPQLSLVHLLGIEQHICVHFDLHCQDLDLIGGDLELVRLAVELQAIDWLEAESVLRCGAGYLIWLSLRCPDESKLNVRVKIAA